VVGLGSPFEIESPGIDAILSLIEAHDIKAEEVDRIDCGVSYTTPLSLIHPNPKTGLEGQFSMGFCISVALVDRKVGLAQFTDEKVNDPRVQSLMKKFHLYIRPDLKGVESSGSNACNVRVRMRNGEEYTKSVDRSKGSSDNPLSKEGQVNKFRDCAGVVLPDRQVNECLNLIEHMEGLREICQLTDIIRA